MLPFQSPCLLAPMEGVTDRLFRSLVLARNAPETLGGATTEFVRITGAPLAVKQMRKELAGENHGRPVGLQLMGSKVEAVAISAAHAAEAGAPFIDLNFGCPAKGALRGCAGSALLDDPIALGKLVEACAKQLEGTNVPLTAKLRAGGENDKLLEDLVKAAADNGAAMITLHCRTRKEAYRDTADWQRLRRAVAVTGVPICGNGGIETHAGIARMLNETGCHFAMIGRAALRDPWIFSGHAATKSEATTFFREYHEGLSQRDRPTSNPSASRLKQLASYWTAAGLFENPNGESPSPRRQVLRLGSDAEVLAAIQGHAGQARI